MVRLRGTLLDFLWAGLALNCPGVTPLLSRPVQVRTSCHLCHLQVGGAIQAPTADQNFIETQFTVRVWQLCLHDSATGIPGQKSQPVFFTVRQELEKPS